MFIGGSIFDKSRWLGIARAVRNRLDPARRSHWTLQSAQIGALRRDLGRQYASGIRNRATSRCVLVVGLGDVSAITFQAPLLNAFRLAGYRPIVLSESSDTQLQKAYKQFGVDDFMFYEDRRTSGAHPELDRLAGEVRTAADLKALRYKEVPVGKYALSTAMRRMRVGDVNVTAGLPDPFLREVLNQVVNDTDAALRIISSVKPDALLCLDHGYTPDGPLFDAALAFGSACFTWNGAHRNGRLMLKRYRPQTSDQHPSSLSQSSWAALQSMPWDDTHWARLRDEIEGCYRRGEWYSEVGTQVGRQLAARDDLVAKLHLRPGRKVAAIFPHIFWDASFFWGEDLFRNYEAWFVEALRAASKNDAVDWLIKIHPGNTVKDRRDGHYGEHSELTALKHAIGELPANMRLIPAHSEISTFALYSVIDYCLTVRGTVGIEAACFGIPVITAGTGRYDRLGFTIDPSSTQEYLNLLGHLQDVAPLPKKQIDLARRYAYGVFISRPTELKSFHFEYRKDATASLAVEIRSKNPFGSDIAAIADWISSGEEDFLNAASTMRNTTNDGVAAVNQLRPEPDRVEQE